MKTYHIEYGTGKTTVVYIVNPQTREDIVAVPVLFTENRKVMATITCDLLEKQGR